MYHLSKLPLCAVNSLLECYSLEHLEIVSIGRAQLTSTTPVMMQRPIYKSHSDLLKLGDRLIAGVFDTFGIKLSPVHYRMEVCSEEDAFIKCILTP